MRGTGPLAEAAPSRRVRAAQRRRRAARPARPSSATAPGAGTIALPVTLMLSMRFVPAPRLRPVAMNRRMTEELLAFRSEGVASVNCVCGAPEALHAFVPDRRAPAWMTE